MTDQIFFVILLHPPVYKLSEISFKALEDIPQCLLESIARCFCQKKEVCRKCFYGDRSLSSWLQNENVCSLSQHKWMNPILVIPGEDVRVGGVPGEDVRVGGIPGEDVKGVFSAWVY